MSRWILLPDADSKLPRCIYIYLDESLCPLSSPSGIDPPLCNRSSIAPLEGIASDGLRHPRSCCSSPRGSCHKSNIILDALARMGTKAIFSMGKHVNILSMFCSSGYHQFSIVSIYRIAAKHIPVTAIWMPAHRSKSLFVCQSSARYPLHDSPASKTTTSLHCGMAPYPGLPFSASFTIKLHSQWSIYDGSLKYVWLS